jgi:hypothetical protein
MCSIELYRELMHFVFPPYPRIVIKDVTIRRKEAGRAAVLYILAQQRLDASFSCRFSPGELIRAPSRCLL